VSRGGAAAERLRRRFSNLRASVQAQCEYADWTKRNEVSDSDLRRMRETSTRFPNRPVISVVTAVYNPPERYLRAAIESVIAQAYPYWELCLADDASTELHVRSVLEEFAIRDSRVKISFRPGRGHISAAMNSALDLATGEFVGLLDHDDLLTPDALFEIAAALNRHSDVDMIYSDEDKIDEDGRLMEPFFKPDWCPESFMSRMYTCHFGVYRRSLVEKVGRLRSGFDGSQDYDLVLRLMEKTTRIYHVPRILYHWRIHAASAASGPGVKPYAYDAALRALNEALVRRGEAGRADPVSEMSGFYRVRYEIRQCERVSVVILARDHANGLERCLGSLFAKTAYDDFEVILVDNGISDPAVLATIEKWRSIDRRLHVLRYDGTFNSSIMNNIAIGADSGRYLLFLREDLEIGEPGWLGAMVEQAQREPIGAVGAMLLYRDEIVQHAGVIIGMTGVAGLGHLGHPASSGGYRGALKTINNYSAVTGACLMLRREVFQRVGGFDESLALTLGDVDLCLRVQAAGYRNVWLPHVVLNYRERPSGGCKRTREQIEQIRRESDLIKARWRTMDRPDPCYNPNLSLERPDFSIRTYARSHVRWQVGLRTILAIARYLLGRWRPRRAA